MNKSLSLARNSTTIPWLSSPQHNHNTSHAVLSGTNKSSRKQNYFLVQYSLLVARGKIPVLGDGQKYSHTQAADRSCNTWLASVGHHLYGALPASGSRCNRKLLCT